MKFDFTEKQVDPIKLANIAPVLIKKLDANIKEQLSKIESVTL